MSILTNHYSSILQVKYYFLCLYLGDKSKKIPGSTKGPVPIFRAYGVSKTGNSILAHVHGVTPYFYVDAPENFNTDHCGQFRKDLNRIVFQNVRRSISF